jgi:hypothetical protein
MSRLTEIQKAIEELGPEEKEELRDWLDGYDPAVEREEFLFLVFTKLSPYYDR